jgi:Fe-S cluster biogenesis protein NfuA
VAEVELQGSCAGCPSSTLTLKQGVERMLVHYVPEVKSVRAVTL